LPVRARCSSATWTARQTRGRKSLCEKLEIQGFPTIKYYTAETGDAGADYEDGRDLESLKAFVADRLAEKCLVDAPAACSEREVGFIAKMRGKSGKAELEAEQARLEGLKATPMAPELEKWLSQRLAILAQLAA
jgi:protein disulfide-isomerase A6